VGALGAAVVAALALASFSPRHACAQETGAARAATDSDVGIQSDDGSALVADDVEPEVAERKLSEIREGLARHERMTTEGEAKASRLLEEIGKLDQRMLASARRLDALKTEEAQLAEDYDAQVRGLESFEKERAKAKALVVARLSSIYKRGRLGSSRALAQAATSTEPLRMARYLAAISQSDSRAMRDYDRARVRYQEKLAAVEAKREGVSEKKQALADERKRYERARKDKTALLSSIEKDIAASRVEHERLIAIEEELQRVIAASVREPEPEEKPRSLVSRLFGGSRPEPKPFGDLKGSLEPPVKGELIARFGQESGVGPRHKGVIVRADSDRQVAAVAEGEVVFSGPFPGLGNTLIVNHGGRYHSVYAHLGSILHEVGEKVARYEILGTLEPEDPTLHFELRAEGKALDPEPWFAGGYAGFRP
jgi:septal ring factor EnvC (AmiA/AmiB activator)